MHIAHPVSELQQPTGLEEIKSIKIFPVAFIQVGEPFLGIFSNIELKLQFDVI